MHYHHKNSSSATNLLPFTLSIHLETRSFPLRKKFVNNTVKIKVNSGRNVKEKKYNFNANAKDSVVKKWANSFRKKTTTIQNRFKQSSVY